MYRYEATIQLVIHADGLDAAWHAAKEAAKAARQPKMLLGRAEIAQAESSMTDLHYAPKERTR